MRLCLIAVSALVLASPALANPKIMVPRTVCTTLGVGFSVTAVITNPDPEDTVVVNLSGAPEGISLTTSRDHAGETVAVLGGIIAESSKEGTYQVTWEAIDSKGYSSRSWTTISTEAPVPGDIRDQVREIVSTTHERGIPARDLRALGARALPHILEVLRDTTLKRYWPNAVLAAGMLGLPEAFDSLHAFIWTRFHGEVGTDAFVALGRAQSVLGLIAPTKRSAVDSLIAGSDPRYWHGLPWHYLTYMPAGYLGVAMAGKSIYGLSMTSDGRAVRALEQLSAQKLHGNMRAHVDEAIPRQRFVLQKGWLGVYEAQQQGDDAR